MASRPEIKVTKKVDADEPAQEAPSQRQRPDIGSFRLQVDRQTKATFLTYEAAEVAGLAIKKGHPIVQVTIYNSAEGLNKVLELPTS